MKGSESILQSSLPMIDTGERLTTEFELFSEGDELYAAMARSIRGATRRVFLASYILAADEVGNLLLNELMRQSRRGLDVRVHVDALGSSVGLTRRHRRMLRAAGVRLKRFHQWSWRQKWSFFSTPSGTGTWIGPHPGKPKMTAGSPPTPLVTAAFN